MIKTHASQTDKIVVALIAELTEAAGARVAVQRHRAGLASLDISARKHQSTDEYPHIRLQHDKQRADLDTKLKYDLDRKLAAERSCVEHLSKIFGMTTTHPELPGLLADVTAMKQAGMQVAKDIEDIITDLNKRKLEIGGLADDLVKEGQRRNMVLVKAELLLRPFKVDKLELKKAIDVVSRLSGKFDDLDNKVKDIFSKNDNAVSTKVNELTTKLEERLASLERHAMDVGKIDDTVATRVKELTAGFNERVVALEQRATKAEAATKAERELRSTSTADMEKLEERIKLLEAQLQSAATKEELKNASVADTKKLEQHIEPLEQHLQAVAQSGTDCIEGLASTKAALDKHIGELEEKVQKIERTVACIDLATTKSDILSSAHSACTAAITDKLDTHHKQHHANLEFELRTRSELSIRELTVRMNTIEASLQDENEQLKTANSDLTRGNLTLSKRLEATEELLAREEQTQQQYTHLTVAQEQIMTRVTALEEAAPRDLPTPLTHDEPPEVGTEADRRGSLPVDSARSTPTSKHALALALPQSVALSSLHGQYSPANDTATQALRTAQNAISHEIAKLSHAVVAHATQIKEHDAKIKEANELQIRNQVIIEQTQKKLDEHLVGHIDNEKWQHRLKDMWKPYKDQQRANSQLTTPQTQPSGSLLTPAAMSLPQGGQYAYRHHGSPPNPPQLINGQWYSSPNAQQQAYRAGQQMAMQQNRQMAALPGQNGASQQHLPQGGSRTQQ